jgi:hypothetical protein
VGLLINNLDALFQQGNASIALADTRHHGFVVLEVKASESWPLPSHPRERGCHPRTRLKLRRWRRKLSFAPSASRRGRCRRCLDRTGLASAACPRVFPAEEHAPIRNMRSRGLKCARATVTASCAPPHQPAWPPTQSDSQRPCRPAE